MCGGGSLSFIRPLYQWWLLCILDDAYPPPIPIVHVFCSRQFITIIINIIFQAQPPPPPQPHPGQDHEPTIFSHAPLHCHFHSILVLVAIHNSTFPSSTRLATSRCYYSPLSPASPLALSVHPPTHPSSTTNDDQLIVLNNHPSISGRGEIAGWMAVGNSSSSSNMIPIDYVI